MPAARATVRRCGWRSGPMAGAVRSCLTRTGAGMAWDPAQYLKFAGPRLRPALDLLQRIDAEAPGTVYDLGAGAGNVTRLIAARWPEARIVGVDSSAEMLAKAAA